MAKSIKVENEIYLDSSGISHNRKRLSEILNSTVLYENSSGTNGNISCSENISNFKYLNITTLSGNVHKIKVQNSFILNEMTNFINDNIPYSLNISNTYNISGVNINVTRTYSFLRSYSTGAISGDLSSNKLYIVSVEGFK